MAGRPLLAYIFYALNSMETEGESDCDMLLAYFDFKKLFGGFPCEYDRVSTKSS